MSRFEQADSRDSHGNLQADAAEGARAALSMDSIPPVPSAAGCGDKNSSALQGFPMEGNLISDGSGIIKLPAEPAPRHLLYGTGGRAGGASSDTYLDYNGGGGERYPGSGQNFKASADVPTPPVQTL